MTQKLIRDFLTRMESAGSVKGTLATYRRQLNLLYKLLPEDKCIRPGSINAWRDELFEQGYAGRIVGKAVSVANSFLTWLGRRELQGDLFQSHAEDIQPELTRNEYLRLLSTAKKLGKERVYLLNKVFNPHQPAEPVKVDRGGGPGEPGTGCGSWIPAAGTYSGVCEDGTALICQKERNSQRPNLHCQKWHAAQSNHGLHAAWPEMP